MANPNAPCAELTGNTSVCEEDNYINICLTSNSGLDHGRWNIIGRNSTSFKSIRGMQGNSQEGGGCIQIYNIPDMPFYPQTITIKYWNSDIGESISRTITIRDCDRDDPTCEEYYSFQSPSAIDVRSKELHIDAQERNLIVFDLMGNRFDITEEDLKNQRKYTNPQILIFTYWNQNGKLVESKKVLY